MSFFNGINKYTPAIKGNNNSNTNKKKNLDELKIFPSKRCFQSNIIPSVQFKLFYEKKIIPKILSNK